MPSVVRLPVTAAAQTGQVLLQALGAYGRAEQFALALQQVLIGAQFEQAFVVAIVVVAGARGQFQQHLPVAFLVIVQQRALLVDLFAAQLQHLLAVVQQGEHLAYHLFFQQVLFLRQDTRGQQLLQRFELAALEQRLIAAHLAQQGLLGRQRQYLGTVDAQFVGQCWRASGESLR